MQSAKTLAQTTSRRWRAFSRCCAVDQATQSQTRLQTYTQTPISKLPPKPKFPLGVPQPEGEEKKFSSKIETLVNEISKLSLIEVGELSQLLKKRLNLPDAPVMPMGGFAAMAPAAKAEEEEEDAPKKTVKTSFTIKLMKFDEKQKVPLIKEVKNLIEGMNLVQAKKFVESSPVVVKADVSKDEAEKLKEAFEKVGGECVVE